MRNRLNGKPILDATEPLSFRVTARDVSRAHTASPTTCALARGLTHIAGIKSVRIGQNIALVELKNQVLRYSIPRESRKKIRAFDKAHYFQPDKYTLVPPAGPESESGRKAECARRRDARRNHSRRGEHVARRAPMRHALRLVAAEPNEV